MELELVRLFYSLRSAQTYITLVVTLSRTTLKDFTFSDGTVLPVGTFLSATQYATHHDESRYNEPFVFNPDRFAVSEEYEGGPKFQLVTPSPDYVPWGLGKHAWYVDNLD
jgi:cytochrome P450